MRPKLSELCDKCGLIVGNEYILKIYGYFDAPNDHSFDIFEGPHVDAFGTTINDKCSRYQKNNKHLFDFLEKYKGQVSYSGVPLDEIYKIIDIILPNNQSAGTSTIEQSCRICHKMNDIGVQVCWNCGSNPN